MTTILQRFKDLFLPDREPKPQPGDRRLFLRFSTERGAELYLYIRLDDGTVFPIADLSYGGLALDVPMNHLEPYLDTNRSFEASLVCFHLEYRYHFVFEADHGKLLGLSIAHFNMEGMLWLRGILEYFRVGYAMAELTGSDRPANLPATVKCFRSTINTNAKFTYEDEELIRVDVSFRDAEFPAKLEFIEGDIAYRRFDDRDDDSFLALQQGFFILYGFLQINEMPGLENIIEAFYEEINRIYDPKNPFLEQPSLEASS